jgi:hypothetical protein
VVFPSQNLESCRIVLRTVSVLTIETSSRTQLFYQSFHSFLSYLNSVLILWAKTGSCGVSDLHAFIHCQVHLLYSAVAFCARMRSWKPRIIQDNSVVHTILVADGGHFCLPCKVAPLCCKSVNIPRPSVWKHTWFMPIFFRGESHYFRLCA